MAGANGKSGGGDEEEESGAAAALENGLDTTTAGGLGMGENSVTSAVREQASKQGSSDLE